MQRNSPLESRPLHDQQKKAEIALIATMVMPHLILARSKDGNDGSITKTIGRRLDQWLNGNFMDLFLEAKALQERLPKKSKKDHDEYKEFDKYMTTGRISSAIRCLSEDVKGGNLSTTEKITVGGKTRTVLISYMKNTPKVNHVTLPLSNKTLATPYHTIHR